MRLLFSLYILELIGTVAFALSGVVQAKKSKLDIFGAVVLGVITAVGGGVLRDILLGDVPPVMFREPIYASVALVTSLAAFAVEKRSGILEDSARLTQWLNAADALGLAIFAVSGTNRVIESPYGDHFALAVIVGVLTAVGGGILRDMMAGQIPMVLRKRVYAVAALAGALIFYLLRYSFGLSEIISGVISIPIVILIRYLAIRYQWNLPSFDEKTHSKA